MNLESPVTEIKGVGEKIALYLKKLNIETVRDLIFYIPRDFVLFESPVEPLEDMSGSVIAFRGYLKPGSFVSAKKGHFTYSHMAFTSGARLIRVAVFNMPYLKKQLDPSKEYVIRGVLEVGSKGAMSMTQPKIYTVKQYSEIEGTLQPVYPLTKGISNNAISKAVRQSLEKVDVPNDGMDDLYDGYMCFSDAVRNMHFPLNMDTFILARERIVFHEFLSFVLQMKTDANLTKNIPFDKDMIETADTQRLIERLPYRLTSAQLRCWDDIKNDMTSGICMNRLIQGDVGSGKTIIAFLALIMNSKNSHQGVLMAPTEVLARQHYDKLIEMSKKYYLDLNVKLLLGSMSASAKKAAYEEIENGSASIIIGTHAVFQKKVNYNDLTLVITDEQHRFGVNQRETLVNKGDKVHLLVMSATPIPRTLAFILYGDISISLIDELPGDRIPIKNCVVGKKFRKKSYEFISEQIKEGHQAYVICPQIEEGDDPNLENVTDYCAKLSSELGDKVNVVSLHGKMKPEEKDRIMTEFKNKNIDVLVSTTVIEVGIDVPNATVMMIENSERFGLAQLHQLRGRVGRGKAQSYCIFISSKEDKDTLKRLSILNETNDGFRIADEDLKLRGPGDLFGIRQSGEFGFIIGDIYNDANILKKASECAQRLINDKDSKKLDMIIESINRTMINSVDFRTI
ncbi:MAG: ATP-dependent DNA helicase RecG [Lachnospiraceae bacterium]|nr:ATP-dependent DNA helicase RecG [Lachnospiraceae bacterium]